MDQVKTFFDLLWCGNSRRLLKMELAYVARSPDEEDWQIKDVEAGRDDQTVTPHKQFGKQY